MVDNRNKIEADILNPFHDININLLVISFLFLLLQPHLFVTLPPYILINSAFCHLFLHVYKYALLSISAPGVPAAASVRRGRWRRPAGRVAVAASAV